VFFKLIFIPTSFSQLIRLLLGRTPIETEGRIPVATVLTLLHSCDYIGGKMDFAHTVIIALLVAFGIAQAISFAIQARVLQKIHEETNKTSLTVQTTLDAAIEILRRLNTKT
jgi:hypothetical protein